MIKTLKFAAALPDSSRKELAEADGLWVRVENPVANVRLVDLEHDARRTARTAGVAAAEAIASEDAEAELGGRASRARLMPSRADVLPRRRGYEPRGPSHQRFDPMVRG